MNINAKTRGVSSFDFPSFYHYIIPIIDLVRTYPNIQKKCFLSLFSEYWDRFQEEEDK